MAVCPFDEDIVHSVFGVRFTKNGFEMKPRDLFSAFASNFLASTVVSIQLIKL